MTSVEVEIEDMDEVEDVEDVLVPYKPKPVSLVRRDVRHWLASMDRTHIAPNVPGVADDRSGWR